MHQKHIHSEMHNRHNLGTSEFDVIESCYTVITISILAVQLESEGENTHLPCSVSTSNLNLLCKPSEVLPPLV